MTVGRRTVSVILASVLAPTSDSRSRYGLSYASASAGLGDELGKRAVNLVRGQVHEHGRPGADRLGDVEDPHELPLLQADDVDHEVRQPIGVELEHEVA